MSESTVTVQTPPADIADRVIISDINIPFWSIVSLMIKISIAAIPAGIAISFIWMMIASFFVGLTR